MTTIYKSTVSSVLQLVSDALGESTVNTNAFRIRSLSRAEQDVAQRERWIQFLRRLATVTGDATNDYTIGDATYPMREKGLNEVYVGGTTDTYKYQLINYFQYNDILSSNSTAKVAYEYYDAANDLFKVHINPAPATGTTIYYSYYWIPPIRTLTTDVIVCPNIQILVNIVLGDVEDNAGEEDGESYRTKAELLLEEAKNKANSTAQGQLYSMGTGQPSTKQMGLGRY